MTKAYLEAAVFRYVHTVLSCFPQDVKILTLIGTLASSRNAFSTKSRGEKISHLPATTNVSIFVYCGNQNNILSL